MRNAYLAQIIVVVQASIALSLAFGLELSEGQVAGIVAVVSAVGSLAVLVNDRRRHPAP